MRLTDYLIRPLSLDRNLSSIDVGNSAAHLQYHCRAIAKTRGRDQLVNQTVIESSCSRVLHGSQESIAKFLLKHDLIMFDLPTDAGSEDDYLDLTPSIRDYGRLKDCLFAYIVNPSADQSYETIDPVTDQEKNNWRISLTCKPTFVELKLRQIPSSDLPEFECFSVIRFDLVGNKLIVSTHVSYPKSVEATGIRSFINSLTSKYQESQIKEDVERETLKLADSIIKDFSSAFEFSSSPSQEKTTASNRLPLSTLTNKALFKIFASSPFRPQRIHSVKRDVSVRCQILYFASGQTTAHLSDHELIILNSGHGAIVRVIRTDLEVDYYIEECWGPLGETADIQMQLDEVLFEKFKVTNLVCKYYLNDIPKQKKPDVLHGESRDLLLSKDWKYYRLTANTNLHSLDGASSRSSWIVFPIDEEGWEVIKQSMGIS